MILSTHGIVGSQIQSFVGLLDTYPNAAAAYSVRKLRTAYTGNAIKVRRSSDNTEQNIGFTALGDLDTTALTSFCSGTNGFVTTWYDQSGNSRDALQTTAINQPRIVNIGVIEIQNTKPSLRFINSSQNYLLPGDVALTAFSIFAPVIISSGTSSHSIYVRGTSGLSTNYTRDIYFSLKNTSPSQLEVQRSSSSLFPTAIKTGTISNYNLYSGNYNSTTLNAYINGVVGTSANAATTLGTTGTPRPTIGASSEGSDIVNYLNGLIPEIILYSTDQSSNRAGIESNINSYYGIY
jgi:hypothetical protein